MTEEQTNNEELDVVFVGTREVGNKRQLVFRANGEHFMVDAGSQAFLAGKRVLEQGKKVAAVYDKAVEQGIVEA